MAQRLGEAHTAHTFLGVTGACPGFSLQACEGDGAFGAALRDVFADDTQCSDLIVRGSPVGMECVSRNVYTHTHKATLH